MADQSTFWWGLPVDVWDNWGLRLMVVGAVLGLLALVASLCSSFILYKTGNVFQSQVSDAQSRLNSETGRLAKETADANRKTEELRADNLALQKIMQPRRLGSAISLSSPDEPTPPPPATVQFGGITPFPNTLLLIQVVPDFEAQMLANDLVFVAQMFGWRPTFITEADSGVPPNLIRNGVRVTYTRDGKFAAAASALAEGLTKAGLTGPEGWGLPRVSAQGLTVFPGGGAADFPGDPKIDPSVEAVIVLVGMKPIPLAKVGQPKQ